jgi:ribosomal protein L33
METKYCPTCKKQMVTIEEPHYCAACRTADNPIPEKSGAPWPLEGRTYIMKINGTRSLNGKLAGHTMFGDVEACEEGKTVWDVLRAIIDKAEADHAKVEHVQWVSLELRPADLFG